MKTINFVSVLLVLFVFLPNNAKAALTFDKETLAAQKALLRKGYAVGKPDGLMGSGTQKLIRRYQAAMDLAQGPLDQATLISLGVVAKPRRISLAKLHGTDQQQYFLQAGHKKQIRDIDVSADGRFFVTAAGDNTAKLWQQASGRVLRSFSHSDSNINSAKFSADGQFIATAGDELLLWETSSGKLVRRLGRAECINSVEFVHADQALLISRGNGSCSPRRAELWDIRSGLRLQAFDDLPKAKKSDIGDAVYDESRGWVIGARGTEVLIWQASNGELMHRLGGHSDSVTELGLSSNGRYLVSAGQGSEIRLWDLRSMSLKYALQGPQGFAHAVAMSSDNRYLATGHGGFFDQKGTLNLWRISDGKLLSSKKTHLSRVNALRFDGTNAYLFSGGGRGQFGSTPELEDGRINLWRHHDMSLAQTFSGYANEITGLVSLPLKQALLSSHRNGDFNLWSLTTGALLKTFTAELAPENIAISPDEQLLASCVDLPKPYRSQLRLHRMADGRLIKTITQKNNCDGLEFSPNGLHLAASNGDRILLLDTENLTQQREFDKTQIFDQQYGYQSLDNFVFSGDSTSIYVAAPDRIVQLDIVSGSRIQRMSYRKLSRRSTHVSSMQLSSDGDYLYACDSEYGISQWALSTTRRTTKVKDFHCRGGFELLAGKQAVLAFDRGSYYGANKVQHWNFKSKQNNYSLNAHTDHVVGLVSLPAGRAASASSDGTIRIWDLGKRKTLLTIASVVNSEQPGTEWISISPDGYFTGTEQAAKRINISQGMTVTGIENFYDALKRPDLVAATLQGTLLGVDHKPSSLGQIMDAGLAPRVDILLEQDVLTASSSSYRLPVKISDAGGGIGKLEWKVNGVTKGVKCFGSGQCRERALGLIAKNNKPSSKTLELTVTLGPGDNLLELIAYNRSNKMASEPAEVNIIRRTAIARAPKLHILAIGINDYFDTRLQLNYAVNDVNKLVESLVDASDDLYSDIDTTLLLNEASTKQGIDKAFVNISKQLGPEDVFMLFVAGHGLTVDGRYYFIPQDFRYRNQQSVVNDGIGQGQWQSWLASVPAEKSILMFDTCESGSLTDMVATRGMEQAVAIDKLGRSIGRTIISASSDTGPALEGYKGHGLFTYALLQAIEHADISDNGFVEVTELVRYIDEQVPQLSKKAFNTTQIPQFQIKGHNFPVFEQKGSSWLDF